MANVAKIRIAHRKLLLVDGCSGSIELNLRRLKIMIVIIARIKIAYSILNYELD